MTEKGGGADQEREPTQAADVVGGEVAPPEREQGDRHQPPGHDDREPILKPRERRGRGAQLGELGADQIRKQPGVGLVVLRDAVPEHRGQGGERPP
jgi:hypothetical protein